MTQGRRKQLKHHATDDELNTAIKHARQNNNAALLQRLCFIKNLYAGDKPQDAADRVGVSQPTSTRWINQWNQGGINALEPSTGGGRPPKLTDRQRGELTRILTRKDTWTTEEIRDTIANEFNVEYSTRHVARLAKQLGMTNTHPGWRMTEPPEKNIQV